MERDVVDAHWWINESATADDSDTKRIYMRSMFVKEEPRDLYVRTNACFTRRACVKKRVKLIVDSLEMC